MKCKCRQYGIKHDYDKVAEESNSYFDGEFDYSLNGWEGFCANCAISTQEYEV